MRAAPSVLEDIVASVRRRLHETPPRADLHRLAAEAADVRRQGGLRSLAAALNGPRPAVIAECKRASPSAGLLRSPFDAAELAVVYAANGAAAISVVTEPDHFRGQPEWIGAVRAQVDLPVLRKDFIVDARQLDETALLGADAVLLIQRLLTPDALAALLEQAAELHLEVLLEIFADEDPAPAVASGADILGVNARDLATFVTRLDRVEEIAAELPSDRVRVAESGLRTAEDLQRLAAVGYDGFLIGETLVRAADPGRTLRALRGREDG